MLIFGYKTQAMFDLWSIEHFINGIAGAGFAEMLTGKLFKKTEISQRASAIIIFILVLTTSLFWECIEHYIEAGVIPGLIGERVTFWFQGVEHWSNRLIGDTLTVLLGWYVYTKRKILALPAKLFSVGWLLVHIFAFPDSMYLHRLLFR